MRATLIRSADEGSVAAAVRYILDGGVIAFPTDTVYGLGCAVFDERAVQRLFDVKRREKKPVPVLCASEDAAARLVLLDGTALALARKHWPGALTIVAPLKLDVPSALHQGTGWMGVRVPASEIARSIAGMVGGYVTGTSANLSGRPSCRSAEEVEAALGDRVDAILDGGVLEGVESTVVRVEGSTVEVLRRGAIGIEQGIARESFER